MFRRCNPVLLALIFSFTSGTGLQAQGWKVGLGRADITPKQPVWMYGYDKRDHRSEGVTAPIFVKALAIEDAKGHRGILVTSDLGAVYTTFCEDVYALVADKVAVPREQIIFAAAHNHSAPIVSGMSTSFVDHVNTQQSPNPVPGPVGAWTNPDDSNPERAPEINAYTETVKRKMAQTILDAVADLQPAELSWGTGFAPFVMNRREFTPRGVILGVNPRGPVDRSVPVLKITRPDGTLRGVLFGCACHNTTLGAVSYQICGEYAGFAQSYLEENIPGSQAMFITGCAGDANPYPRSGPNAMDLTMQHGRTLGVEVARVLAGPLEPVRGPLTMASEIAQLPFRTDLDQPALQKMAQENSYFEANSQQLIELLESHQPLATILPAPISIWQFGDDLTLVMLSGEVVVDYVYQIEQAIGQRKLWIAAYTNDIFYGYLTSTRVQREGGYEAQGMTGLGVFADNAQEALVATVKKLAKNVGRPPTPALPSSKP